MTLAYVGETGQPIARSACSLFLAERLNLATSSGASRSGLYSPRTIMDTKFCKEAFRTTLASPTAALVAS